VCESDGVTCAEDDDAGGSSSGGDGDGACVGGGDESQTAGCSDCCSGSCNDDGVTCSGP
jgi:hypothetical protein